MNTRHLSALLLCMLLQPACGGGSNSAAPPTSLAAILDTSGGESDSAATIGAGGFGGFIRILATGAIAAGTGDTPPSPSTVPAAPSTGTELTNALITAGTPVAGNILVSSTLQITAAPDPSIISTTTGDVVVSGSLLGARTAGTATRTIQINAPTGTIYVLGEIRTRGTPGAIDNPDGGAIVLSAKRIVITGSLDARGEDLAAGAGGAGGAVTLTTTGAAGDNLLIVGGAIRSGGGSGTTLGGKGGDVTATAADVLDIHGTIVTDGGAATSASAFPTAGLGGGLTLSAAGRVDIVGTLSLRGGVATGGTAGAAGGNGGTLTTESPVPYRVYGAVATAGGGATAQAESGPTPLKGGDAGMFLLGSFVTQVASVEIGRGAFVTSGGAARNNGASGGAILIESWDGNVRASGPFLTQGSAGDSFGGSGGNVTIQTDQEFGGNTANHTVDVDGPIDTSTGFYKLLANPRAGRVAIFGGGNIIWNGSIDSSGKGNNAFGAAVNIRTQAANLAATGRLDAAGTINAQGMALSGTLKNGPGMDVRLFGSSGLTFTGSVINRGFDAGIVSIGSAIGDVDVSATIVSTTDRNTLLVRTPSSVGIGGGGNVHFSGSIDVSAGDVDPSTPNLAGGAGGIITLSTTVASGVLTVAPGSEFRADGGAAVTGAGHPSGGAGGWMSLNSVDQPVVMHGSFRARGGANPADAGGLGGQFLVNTDSDGNGTGGAITLAADVLVDVSGGTGAAGGSARNNGGVAPATSNAGNLAVVLDAAGAFASSPDGVGVGVIRNLGRIVATGGSPAGRGGDIWYDGQSPGGAELGLSDKGNAVLTGAAGDGVYFPN